MGAREKTEKNALPYRVVCISMYHEDIRRLDAIVERLKDRNVRGVSRSSVIREALEHFNAKDVGRVIR